MSSMIKKMAMTIAMACMCICMCWQPVQAESIKDEDFLVRRNQYNYALVGAKKSDLSAVSMIYPLNSSGAYTNYVSIFIARKDCGAPIRSTDATCCRSNQVISQKIYTSHLTTKQLYYLGALMYPSATADFGYFKYRLTP